MMFKKMLNALYSTKQFKPLGSPKRSIRANSLPVIPGGKLRPPFSARRRVFGQAEQVRERSDRRNRDDLGDRRYAEAINPVTACSVAIARACKLRGEAGDDEDGPRRKHEDDQRVECAGGARREAVL